LFIIPVVAANKNLDLICTKDKNSPS
jgi:hypothetical protein